MRPRIGFVVLLNPYNALSQADRLFRKLNAMFDFPPIACHHDFSKCPEFLTGLPPNIRLVDPYLVTKWADFSCVEAAIHALRMLYTEMEAPDWFVYLSGADYPIKPAGRILDDLGDTPYDVHLEHILIEYRAARHAPLGTRAEGHKGPGWPRICHRRYCSVTIPIPSVSRHLEFKWRNLVLENPLFTSGHIPFNNRFHCYAGEAWFCANRRAAEAVLDSYENNQALIKHYRQAIVPEESYFHTVFGNTPGLRLSHDPLRYMDWTAGGDHPKELTVDDLPQLRNTNAHFARKFPVQMSEAFMAAVDGLSK